MPEQSTEICLAIWACTRRHNAIQCIIEWVAWLVQVGDEFEPEFAVLPKEVRVEIIAISGLLKQFRPHLERPRVGTLNNPRHPNMKEMRFDAAGGVWRVAFAFDTKRRALLLVAGDKSGVSRETFYKRLIAKANKRFDAHLARRKEEELAEKKQKRGK